MTAIRGNPIIIAILLPVASLTIMTAKMFQTDSIPFYTRRESIPD